MLWSGSETPEHQQVRFRNTRTPAGCEHTPRKTHAKKLFHVTFGTHKKQALLWSGSETPMPKNSFASPLEPIKNNALVRFRNTRTPAGPVPKHPNTRRMRAHATQDACQKTLSRHLWNPKKQTLLWSGSETPMPKNSFTSPLEPIKNNKKQCFGTVPKHPNWSGSETPEH